MGKSKERSKAKQAGRRKPTGPRGKISGAAFARHDAERHKIARDKVFILVGVVATAFLRMLDLLPDGVEVVCGVGRARRPVAGRRAGAARPQAGRVASRTGAA